MNALPTDPASRPATAPAITFRRAQRYAGIHMRLEPDAFKAGIDEGFPELFAWLAARGIAPAGAAFIRYHAMEPCEGGGTRFDLDLGVPIDAAQVTADGWAHLGELPAGRWVVATHIGSYDGLRDATAALGAWSRAQGLTQATGADGRHLGWAEHYLTDPSAEPDPATWRTEIAVLVD